MAESRTGLILTTIKYNGNVIANLDKGQRAVIECKGAEVNMLSDIVIENADYGIEAVTTVIYNHTTIALLTRGQMAVVQCRGEKVKMLSNIIVAVDSSEYIEPDDNDGADDDIVPDTPTGVGIVDVRIEEVTNGR